MQGKLIVFEGVEGCGKSTQIQLTAAWLSSLGISVLITREPGGTDLGLQLRSLLLSKTSGHQITSTTELLLYAADRSQHVDQELKPNLDIGKFVLCDRYIESTIAYQGYGRDLDMKLIDQLNGIATSGLMSDITIWLDIDVELGFQRKKQDGEGLDRIEQEKIEFHHRVRQGYAQLAKSYPERVFRIDGSLAKEDVQAKIQEVLRERLAISY